MYNPWFLCALLGLSLFIPAVHAADSKSATAEEQIVESVVCTNQKETRRLEVVTNDAGCLLHYQKGGKVNEAARARRGVEVCLKNLKKVQSLLEEAGWKCGPG